MNGYHGFDELSWRFSETQELACLVHWEGAVHAVIVGDLQGSCLAWCLVCEIEHLVAVSNDPQLCQESIERHFREAAVIRALAMRRTRANLAPLIRAAIEPNGTRTKRVRHPSFSSP